MVLKNILNIFYLKPNRRGSSKKLRCLCVVFLKIVLHKNTLFKVQIIFLFPSAIYLVLTEYLRDTIFSYRDISGLQALMQDDNYLSSWKLLGKAYM